MVKSQEPLTREELISAGYKRLRELSESREKAEASLKNALMRFSVRRRTWGKY
jgi:hypothetical protein